MVVPQKSCSTIRHSRSGFTLMELLVVVSIVVALAALTAAAAFQVMASQRRSNSEQLVQSVSRALNREYQAAIDMSNTRTAGEAIPGGIHQMAMECPPGSNVPSIANPARAQVIWTKFVLKREFPTTYFDALNPAIPGTPSLIIQPVRTYQQYFTGLTPVPTTPQAAECLYLALKQSRRGESFDPESLGAAAIRDTDSNGLREIVDAWGTPLAFFLFPVGNAEFQGIGGRYRDPQDPQGLLLDPKWNNQTLYNNRQGVYWFEQNLHLVHDPTQNQWTPLSFYLVPVVASAGKDRQMGFIDPIGAGYALGSPYTGQAGFLNPFMLTLNPNPPPLFLAPDPATYDNIYGYRRFGERGD